MFAFAGSAIVAVPVALNAPFCGAVEPPPEMIVYMPEGLFPIRIVKLTDQVPLFQV